MKKVKFFIAATFVCLTGYANAQGEVIYNCTASGPQGSGSAQGWAIVDARQDISCGIQNGVRYAWRHMVGFPRGSQQMVCGFDTIQNWWPIRYIDNVGSAPCYGTGRYYYIVEYRGN